jgi:hypothetical protein
VAALVAGRHGIAKADLTRVSPFTENDVMIALAVFSRAERALIDDGLESWLEPNP